MNERQIVTFYSYKGGVGRTFALANVAAILARWGCRVLCVDWDLEAPGLHFYLSVEPSSGLIDLLEAVQSGTMQDWRQCVHRVDVSNTDGRLHLIPAGRQHEGYVAAVQAFDWDALYAEHDIGSFFEQLREEWAAAYDLVLIDSRTGISDIGAICTAQLPDIVVTVLTASHQGLAGVIDVANRAEQARRRLPYERSKLLILPVPCRFDVKEEYDLAKEWKRRFTDKLAPFYTAWLHERVDVSRAIDLCTVPYIAKWSFGEELAVTGETRSPSGVTYALENIAGLLRMEFERTDYFAENPDSYVDLAKRETARSALALASRSASRFRYDVFISHPHRQDSRQFAQTLQTVLVQRGWRCILADDLVFGSGSTRSQKVLEALAESQHFALLVDDTFNTWQEDAVFNFLHQSIEERSPRVMIPIRLGSLDPRSLPSVLSHTQFIDARSCSPILVAEDIEKALRPQDR